MALTGQYKAMKVTALRGVVKGKFRGVSSTKSEKTQARLELKRRGLKVTLSRKQQDKTPLNKLLKTHGFIRPSHWGKY